MVAGPRKREEARGLRPHRAWRGLGRGRDPDDGRAPRRLVGDQRLEDVHHQRGHGHHRVRDDHRAHRATDQISNIIIPNGTAGYVISEPMQQARLARFGHARALVPGLRGARGEPAWAAREGLPPVPRDPRRRPDLGVGDVRRARAGSVRPRGGLRAGATSSSVSPIAKFQSVQFALADMATEIDAGRLLTYKAAWLKDRASRSRRRRRWRSSTRASSRTAWSTRAPDPRRLRVHGRVRDLPPLPRPEDPRDRRGHERGAADGDRTVPSSIS